MAINKDSVSADLALARKTAGQLGINLDDINSPEGKERALAALDQAEQKHKESQGQLGQNIGQGISSLGNVFLQKAGIKGAGTTSPIDTILKTQQAQLALDLKQQQGEIAAAKEAREAEKFKREAEVTQKQASFTGKKGQTRTEIEAGVKAKPITPPTTTPKTTTQQAGTTTPVDTQVTQQEVWTGKFDEMGDPIYEMQATPAGELQLKGQETITTERAKTKAALEKSIFATQSNLNLVAGTARDFAQVYAEAIIEGGAGGLIPKAIGKAATKVGDIPGVVEIGGKFPSTGALVGKTVELIAKIMPMLTQQATKPEGSIRLVTTVFEALKLTVPDEGTAPKQGIKQLTETIRSMYRFAKAAENTNASFDAYFGKSPDEVGDKELQSWTNRITKAMEDVTLSPEEQEFINNITSEVTEPIELVVEAIDRGLLGQLRRK